jgi:hypothetical protein
MTQPFAPDPIPVRKAPKRSARVEAGHDRRTLTRIAALEQSGDVLNRVAAGVRSATINKLLFDETEAAIVLGISPETLKVWRREGRGPAWVRLGDNKLVRYALIDLEDYVTALPKDAARDTA